MSVDMTEEQIKVTDKMRALCSRREYCSSDIFAKVVKALDGDKEASRTVVDRLISEKYIDDSRYAAAFVRDKSSISGWGETKIRYMLSAIGIARDVISQALNETDPDKASSRLEKLMVRKAAALKDDPQRRLKLIRYGLGRGYLYEEVSSVVDRIEKQQW